MTPLTVGFAPIRLGVSSFRILIVRTCPNPFRTTKGQQIEDAIRMELDRSGKWAYVPDTALKSVSLKSFKATVLKGQSVQKQYFADQLEIVLKEFPAIRKRGRSLVSRGKVEAA
jgi:hypothetical protein